MGYTVEDDGTARAQGSVMQTGHRFAVGAGEGVVGGRIPGGQRDGDVALHGDAAAQIRVILMPERIERVVIRQRQGRGN